MGAVEINVERRSGRICVTGPSGMESGMDGEPICVDEGDGWQQRLSEAIKGAHRINGHIEFIFAP